MARKSAGERREEILAAAIERFALEGYRAASTEAIARDAGISQPYLFRLFRTKRELFLACHARGCDRILETFRSAAQGVPRERRFAAMGDAYMRLLEDRTQLLLQMQSYAASSDPQIQTQVRDRYGELVAEVARLSGGEPHEVWGFFANGMLLNVLASLDLDAIAEDDAWAKAWSKPGPLIVAAEQASA